MWWSVNGIVLLLLAVFFVYGDEEDNARILASKRIVNQFLVEGRDITIEYRLFNVGSNAAIDVELTDDSFSDADFEKKNGLHQVYWDRIAPGMNVTHAVVVKPVRAGFFNFSSAAIAYLTSDTSSEKTIGYTSAPGEGEIIDVKDFDRRFSPHFLDWIVFAIMTMPSLGIPYFLWYKSMIKYDPAYAKKAQ